MLTHVSLPYRSAPPSLEARMVRTKSTPWWLALPRVVGCIMFREYTYFTGAWHVAGACDGIEPTVSTACNCGECYCTLAADACDTASADTNSCTITATVGYVSGTVICTDDGLASADSLFYVATAATREQPRATVQSSISGGGEVSRLTNKLCFGCGQRTPA